MPHPEKFHVSQSEERDRYLQRNIRRRRHRSTCLLGSLLVILLASFGALVTFILYSQGRILTSEEALRATDTGKHSDAMTDEWCEKTCLTAECVQTAAYVLERLDRTVDPCDDFYEFSCGNYLRTKTVPDDHYQASSFDSIKEELLVVLKNKLEAIGDSDSILERRAKIYYESCLNETDADDMAGEFRQILAELKIGEWPILEDHWDDQSFDFELSLSMLDLYGTGLFFTAMESQSEDNTSLFQLEIYNSYPFLSLEAYLSNETERRMELEQYRKVLNEVYRLLGVPENKREAEIDSVVEFETKYARICKDEDEDSQNETSSATDSDYDGETSEQPILTSRTFISKVSEENEDNSSSMAHSHSQKKKISLIEFQERYPDINWIKIFQAQIAYFGLPLDISNIVLSVSIGDTFFKNFITLIKETPPRILANYMNVFFFLKNLLHMGTEFRKICWDNNLVFKWCSRMRRYQSQWKFCISALKDQLPVESTALYLKDPYKVEIEDMIEDIFSKMKSIVRARIHSFYQDEDNIIKEVLLKKVNTMQASVGYSKGYFEQEDSQLQFTDSLLRNNIMITVARKIQNLKRVMEGKRHFENDSIAIPLEVNAFYNVETNVISIPLGYLHPYKKYLDLPRYASYGSLGGVVGHEFMHGMTMFNRESAEHLTDNSTLANVTMETYNCLSDQYSKFPHGSSGEMISGKRTVDENMADNGAVMYAFKVYSEYLDNNDEEIILPSLHYTNKQMFFIFFSQLWCEVLDERGERRYLEDAHSLGRYRAIVPLSNSKDFAEAFRCPLGSPMNPVEKCESWMWS